MKFSNQKRRNDYSIKQNNVTKNQTHLLYDSPLIKKMHPNQILQCIQEVDSFNEKSYNFQPNKQILQQKIDQISILLSKNRDPSSVQLALKSCQIIMGILQSTAKHSIYQSPPLKNGKQFSTYKKQHKMKQFPINNKIKPNNHQSIVIELSQICEQVPQLQTFRRNLMLLLQTDYESLSADQSIYFYEAFRKIIDVLIQLHHKIDQLNTERPQQLTGRLQSVNTQCNILENSIKQFTILLKQNKNLDPIIFHQKTNKSPQCFRKIQRSLTILSEAIIYMDYPIKSGKYSQQQNILKKHIQVFYNFVVQSCQLASCDYDKQRNQLMQRLKQLEGQWNNMKYINLSQNQNIIRNMLEQCFEVFYTELEKVSSIRKQIVSKQQQNCQLENRIQQLTQKLQKYQQKYNKVNQLQQIKQQYQYALSQNSRLQQAQIYYKQKLSEAQNKTKFSKKIISSLTQQNKHQYQRIKELQEQIFELRKQIDESKANQLGQWMKKNEQLQQMIAMIDNSKYQHSQIDKISYECKQQQRKNDENQKNKIQQRSYNNRDMIEQEWKKQKHNLVSEISIKNQQIKQLNYKLVDVNTQFKQNLQNYQQTQTSLQKQRNLKKQIQHKIIMVQSQKNHYYQQFIKTKKQLEITVRDLQQSKVLLTQIQKQVHRRDDIIKKMASEQKQSTQTNASYSFIRKKSRKSVKKHFEYDPQN